MEHIQPTWLFFLQFYITSGIFFAANFHNDRFYESIYVRMFNSKRMRNVIFWRRHTRLSDWAMWRRHSTVRLGSVTQALNCQIGQCDAGTHLSDWATWRMPAPDWNIRQRLVLFSLSGSTDVAECLPYLFCFTHRRRRYFNWQAET
jgi:hypothetical protein